MKTLVTHQYAKELISLLWVIVNTMISPEEKIYIPEPKTPQNENEIVPDRFEYVGPENLASKNLHHKTVIIGGALVISVIVAAAIVVVVTLNEEQSCKSK